MRNQLHIEEYFHYERFFTVGGVHYQRSTVLELMYVLCNVYLQAETGFDGKVLKQGFLLKKVNLWSAFVNIY